MQSTPNGRQLYIDPGCSIESAEKTSTQVTRRANRKKRLTVHYVVEHPNQEGDTCVDGLRSTAGLMAGIVYGGDIQSI